MEKREFKLFIEGVGWINFVNREIEIEQLIELSKRGYAFPLAIYGPEGCGKTTLLRYFTNLVKREEDYVTIYIDALELHDISRAIIASHNEIWNVISSLISFPIGERLAKCITLILRRIHKILSLKNKNVILILDDVYKSIGIENVDKYTKTLYEWIGHLHEEFDVNRVLFIITTSEGISKRILSRHTYVHIYMTWNLPREGFEKLVKETKAPVDHNELWRLTGGNPRALIEIAQFNWNIDKWINYLTERRVLPTIHGIEKVRLESIVKDPDSDWGTAMKLEERGLMIELSHTLVLGLPLKKNIELGIGKRWAWQIPAYREAVKRLLLEIQ